MQERKIYETKQNNKSLLFLLLIFIAILTMSIGYCSLDSITLEISGNLTAEVQEGLFIYEVGMDENNTSSNSSFSNDTVTGTLLSITITLPTPLQVTESTKATILAKVYNNSENTYEFRGINTLTKEDITEYPQFTPLNDNQNIEIDSTSYETIIGTQIKPKESLTIPIAFKYVDYQNVVNNILNIVLNINFDTGDQEDAGFEETEIEEEEEIEEDEGIELEEMEI